MNPSVISSFKMAFYSHQPPFQLYAYAPMAIPNQEFYAVHPYHPGHPGMGSPLEHGQYFYEPPHKSHMGQNQGKHQFVRKDSADSGISAGSSSRKTSTMSSISASSISEAPEEDCIKEETPFEEPDDDLCEKITQQVEFYFSDANITKDKFLLKHVKRNKEGFVSLKLISSFKRVKHLTKDWRQVAFAIKKCSDRLEVNDLETKVRRLEDLPAYDETTPSRTVVVLNLPMDRPTIEGVAEIFTVCGEIVLVRILRPGNPIPADIKQYVAKHPEMTTKVCALVEFERTEFAQKAVHELNDTEDEDKMKVMELTATPLKNGNKKIEARKLAEKAAAMAKAVPQRKFSLQNNFNQPMPMTLAGTRTRRISLMPNMKFGPIVEEIKDVKSSPYALNPNAPCFTMNADGTFQMIPHTNQRRMSNKPVYYASEGPQYMGVPGRRVNSFNNNGQEGAASGLKLPPNVLRMPKGPQESGKGFGSWCRQRMAEPKRVSKAIPIVAPTDLEAGIEGSSSDPAGSAGECSGIQVVPHIQVEAASGSDGSEDEAVVPDKSDSCDSGHEDSCSEPGEPTDSYDLDDTNERTR